MAALLVMMVAGINFFGVVWGGRFQAATTIIKAGFLGLLALLPFVMVLFTDQTIHLANYSTSLVAPDAGGLVGPGTTGRNPGDLEWSPWTR